MDGRLVSSAAAAALRLSAWLAGAAAPGEAQRVASPPSEERIALGAAFIGGNPRGLPALLHAGLIVQPPAPDTALSGKDANAYLMSLAVHTRLDESRLWPQAVTPEGPFLLEQGTWSVRAGDRVLASRYHLRWR